MLIDALFFLFLAMLSLPLVGGHFASTRGRSFWLWFFICLFLPVIGYFIIILLPNLANPLEKELEEIRIKNRMLGINPNAPDEVIASKYHTTHTEPNKTK
jgi:hypothetical protein